MKLVTFRLPHEACDRVGALVGDAAVADLSTHFPSMLALIDAGEAGLEQAQELVAAQGDVWPLSQIELQAPLPEPRQMRDAMTFERHYAQSMAAMARMRVGAPLARLARWTGALRIPRVWYEQPTYYKCNRFAVVGSDADVIWPDGARLMDFECEVAIVIGKSGKNIPPERALSHVFGFTIFNDMTARDFQEREMRGHLGPAKGKDFDTGNVLGPYIATRDEIVDPYALSMVARVDGEEWGRGNSADMYHRWEDVIAHVSRNETLHAGEVIGSGTVGNGCGLEFGRFLSPGALIELEITGLGVLRNRLVRP